jgi:type I restriction enzyme S subunit
MSWQKVKLGQFLKNREGRYKPNDEAIQGLRRIDKINFSGTIFLSDKPSNTDMILVKKGDLVISGINVEKGAMNIYQGDEDVVATIHYSSYEFDEKQIDIDFLTNFLKSLEFKKALKEQVPGGIKTEIKPKHILPLLVQIPTDVNEQKKIVQKLTLNNSIVQNVTSELTHQLDLIKQLRQAFLREAMQGKLVKSTNVKETGQQLLAKIKAEKAQLIAEKKLKKEKELPPITDEEFPFEIPKHWVWCRFNGICETRLGKMLDAVKNKGDLYPYFRNVNVQWYQIKLDDILFMRFEQKELEEYSIKRGDLLICEGGYPGRGAIWDSDDETFKFQKALHRVRFYENIPAKFYLYYLDFICSSGKIKDYFTGSGIQHLTGKSLKEMPIPLPPFHEQEQIVTKLEELMSFCDGLEQSIKKSQGYNEMLLQQVLREALQGEKEVK